MNSNDHKSLNIFGIPVIINPHMPANEMWMIVEGEKISVYHHEGKRAGETVEEWLRRPQIHRVINIGTMTEVSKFPLGTFEINKPDTSK